MQMQCMPPTSKNSVIAVILLQGMCSLVKQHTGRHKNTVMNVIAVMNAFWHEKTYILPRNFQTPQHGRFFILQSGELCSPHSKEQPGQFRDRGMFLVYRMFWTHGRTSHNILSCPAWKIFSWHVKTYQWLRTSKSHTVCCIRELHILAVLNIYVTPITAITYNLILCPG